MNATPGSAEYLVADTYSLTDAQLADSIEFIEEIGEDMRRIAFVVCMLIVHFA